ncbi:hypothetical protein [Myxococcus stipitatus]|uniref:hypothetical protein n=1 Tax=Myxococcus stipitatus TaxID=83455 RepID=UPI0030D49324
MDPIAGAMEQEVAGISISDSAMEAVDDSLSSSAVGSPEQSEVDESVEPHGAVAPSVTVGDGTSGESAITTRASTAKDNEGSILDGASSSAGAGEEGFSFAADLAVQVADESAASAGRLVSGSVGEGQVLDSAKGDRQPASEGTDAEVGGSTVVADAFAPLVEEDVRVSSVFASVQEDGALSAASSPTDDLMVETPASTDLAASDTSNIPESEVAKHRVFASAIAASLPSISESEGSTTAGIEHTTSEVDVASKQPQGSSVALKDLESSTGVQALSEPESINELASSLSTEHATEPSEDVSALLSPPRTEEEPSTSESDSLSRSDTGGPRAQPAKPLESTSNSIEAEPSVAYLDAPDTTARRADSSDEAEAHESTSTPASTTEPWMLASTVRPEPSQADKDVPGEGDTSESLMLEAAGIMLASHGEQASTTARGSTPESATEPLASENVLPLGDVLPGRAGPKPEAAVSTESAPRDDARESSAAAPSEHEDTTLPPTKPPATRRAPIELDELPSVDDAPMQLASTWEFVGWQGAESNGTIGHVAENTWVDRAVDLEGAMSRAEPPAGATASELPIASAWDFIPQTWQPQAREHSEVLTALLASAGATTGSEGPAVSADQVLTALDEVNTQGVLGKVLIAYCAGRFQRAFLLGESFGLVRVGHAWGPGSDGPEVSALKVDLDAPSLLVSALGQFGPSSFDAPSSAQDEAIFTALGGPASHLLVVPIRARGRPVAFIVADSGNTPVPGTTLDELTRVSAKASEVYDRLPASGAD